MEREAEYAVERRNKESAVFKSREQSEIDNDRKRYKQLCYLFASVFFDSERHRIVEHGAEYQQAHPNGFTPRIKYKRCNDKNNIFCLVVLHNKIEEQSHGKENKKKHETRKDHLTSPFLCI